MSTSFITSLTEQERLTQLKGEPWKIKSKYLYYTTDEKRLWFGDILLSNGVYLGEVDNLVDLAALVLERGIHNGDFTYVKNDRALYVCTSGNNQSATWKKVFDSSNLLTLEHETDPNLNHLTASEKTRFDELAAWFDIRIIDINDDIASISVDETAELNDINDDFATITIP